MVSYRKACAIGFAIGVLVGLVTPVALAGTAYSSWKSYGPVLGYPYRNRAFVVTSSGVGAWAYSEVETTDGRNAPAGYMGVMENLYNGSGNLMKTRGWSYTPDASQGYFVPTTPPVTNHGNYYSKGQSRAWNGSSYNTYNTNQSPNQSYQG